MSSLLFDEKPLVVNPQLACILSLNEAIILQQIHYWININTKAQKNKKDGFYWTYNTYAEWQVQFPFWSLNTIIRAIKKLELENYIISANYNSLPQDHTKWYRLNYDVINRLPNLGRLSTQSDEATYPKRVEDLPNMVKALPETTTKTTPEIITDSGVSTPTEFNVKNVIRAYESNIGMVVPLVLESILEDTGKYPVEWLIEAIAIARENKVSNWKYIRAILIRWESEGRGDFGKERKIKRKKDGRPRDLEGGNGDNSQYHIGQRCREFEKKNGRWPDGNEKAKLVEDVYTGIAAGELV